MRIVNITHTYVADSPAHLTTAAYVSPHCAHIFRLMQVTTGMHNIRAFPAEKQQTVNVRREGWRVAVAWVVSLRLHKPTNSVIDYFFFFCFLKGGRSHMDSLQGIKAGEGRTRRLTEGFLLVKCDSVSFFCVRLCVKAEEEKEGERKQKGVRPEQRREVNCCKL